MVGASVQELCCFADNKIVELTSAVYKKEKDMKKGNYLFAVFSVLIPEVLITTVSFDTKFWTNFHFFVPGKPKKWVILVVPSVKIVAVLQNALFCIGSSLHVLTKKWIFETDFCYVHFFIALRWDLSISTTSATNKVTWYRRVLKRK